MKIMYVTEQIHKIGGIEKLLSIKANYLTKYNDFEVIILTSENKGLESYFYLNDKISRVELDVNYNRDEKLSSLSNIKKAIRHFKLLRNEIKRENPEVIVNCCYGFDFYFLPFLKGDRKIIQEVHASRAYQGYNNGKLSWVKNIIRSIFERRYDSVVVLSQEESNFYQSHNVRIIPNPILDSSNTGLSNTKKRKVIAAGRIDPIKGFDRLLKIWSKVGPEYKEWSLDIFGDGNREYINELNATIASYEMEHSVRILPSSKELQKELISSSIYTMTSHTECFPMVLLEAMQAKTAIIAFDCPTGPRSIIRNYKNGILVEDGNIDCFVDNLMRLMDSELKRNELVNNGLVDLEKYELSEVMSQWVDVFDGFEKKKILE